jgi:TMEM175 potassium channel family protein
MKQPSESPPPHTFTASRLETLTDGVFAIVMTLLVLNLSVTNLLTMELPQSLQTISSLLYQFIFTFLVLAVYWIIHHRMFEYLIQTDVYVIWLNLLFLMTIALVPFANGLINNITYFGQTALLIYASDLVLSLIFLDIIWWHVTRHRYLLKPETTPEQILRMRQSLQGFIIIFFLVIAFSFINIEWSSLFLTFLFFYALLSQIIPMKGRSQLLIGITCLTLNIITAVFVITLHLPLYLDSWASSLAVILGGLGIGLIVGVVYNLFMSVTYWGSSSWIWMFSSILVVLITWSFNKKGWITLRKPWRLLSVGIITGILNTILAVFILWAARLPPYQGTYSIYTFFYQLTSNNILASTTENLIVEIIDKTICIALAAIVALYIFKINKNDTSPTASTITYQLLRRKQKKK